MLKSHLIVVIDSRMSREPVSEMSDLAYSASFITSVKETNDNASLSKRHRLLQKISSTLLNGLLTCCDGSLITSASNVLALIDARIVCWGQKLRETRVARRPKDGPSYTAVRFHLILKQSLGHRFCAPSGHATMFGSPNRTQITL